MTLKIVRSQLRRNNCASPRMQRLCPLVRDVVTSYPEARCPGTGDPFTTSLTSLTLTAVCMHEAVRLAKAGCDRLELPSCSRHRATVLKQSPKKVVEAWEMFYKDVSVCLLKL
jgi:hypothetical protein